MSQRLTIHIGAVKTGSSAIQTFLKMNAARLRKQGVVVPDQQLMATGRIDGHHVWYFADRGGSPREHADEVTQRIAALFANPETEQVVISAENLSDHNSTGFLLFDEVAQQYDTEVVVYLRRQDELLVASWQQWWAKAQTDFWAWLISFVGVLANWQVVLERWESIVGRERIRANVYERERLLDADVVTDFTRFLIADTTDLETTDNVVNPTFNAAIAELIPGGDFFDNAHDNAFYAFLDDLLGEASHKKSNESMITFAQRRAILNRYGESNAWVRENYFAEDDVPETLFKMPRPGDYVVPSPDELRREQIQMLARLVFELSKRRK